jgi:virulence-associated protein VapD
MKKFILIIYTMLALLHSENIFKMTMNGDLDDDLFVIKMTNEETSLIKVYQMHNSEQRFQYNDVSVKSERIYGIVDFNEKYKINKTTIYAFMLANEREEFRPEKSLFSRTHYKSTILNINNIELFPSMLPERNNIKGYQTWFNDPNEVCKNKPINPDLIYSDYNYYQLWENAVVNLGLVVKDGTLITINAYNLDGIEVFTYTGKLKKNITIKPIITSTLYKKISKHIFAESNGKVYNNKNKYTKSADKEIIKNAINDIKITIDNRVFYMELPYPLPYINNMYILKI